MSEISCPALLYDLEIYHLLFPRSEWIKMKIENESLLQLPSSLMANVRYDRVSENAAAEMYIVVCGDFGLIHDIWDITWKWENKLPINWNINIKFKDFNLRCLIDDFIYLRFRLPQNLNCVFSFRVVIDPLTYFLGKSFWRRGVVVGVIGRWREKQWDGDCGGGFIGIEGGDGDIEKRVKGDV